MSHFLAVNIGENTPMGIGTSSLGQTFKTPSVLISLIVRDSLVVAGIILLALLIFGGLTFIMNAGGDPKKAQAAQGTITSALVGFAIVFLAYVIIQIIEVITGLNILNPTI